MKKLLAGSALALIASVGMASAGDLTCLITKNNTNPFFVKMKEGAEAAATAAGMDFQAYAGVTDGDAAPQINAIENCVAAGAKGILITPSNDSVGPALIDARTAGVLVIALDTPLAKRHDLSNTSLYSIQSLKLVATLLAPDSANIKKLKSTNESTESFFKNLALIELPGSEDQVFIYEGQIIGKNNARIKKITKNKVILEENQNIESVLHIIDKLNRDSVAKYKYMGQSLYSLAYEYYTKRFDRNIVSYCSPQVAPAQL